MGIEGRLRLFQDRGMVPLYIDSFWEHTRADLLSERRLRRYVAMLAPSLLSLGTTLSLVVYSYTTQCCDTRLQASMSDAARGPFFLPGNAAPPILQYS